MKCLFTNTFAGFNNSELEERVQQPTIYITRAEIQIIKTPVILLPTHPASFVHNFVSGMQSFYFSESQDAIVLQTCH